MFGLTRAATRLPQLRIGRPRFDGVSHSLEAFRISSAFRRRVEVNRYLAEPAASCCRGGTANRELPPFVELVEVQPTCIQWVCISCMHISIYGVSIPSRVARTRCIFQEVCTLGAARDVEVVTGLQEAMWVARLRHVGARMRVEPSFYLHAALSSERKQMKPCAQINVFVGANAHRHAIARHVPSSQCVSPVFSSLAGTALLFTFALQGLPLHEFTEIW